MPIPLSDGSDEEPTERIVEVEHEASSVARQALDLIRSTFPPHERQPLDQIAMEIEEKRLGLLTTYDFHLFAAVEPDERVVAVASGVYLGGVNAGFITYLSVSEEARSKGVGRRIRGALLDAFDYDARSLDWAELAAVVGEVRLESPWLQRLVREREVLPLDFRYFHPGQDPLHDSEEWVLYRQPIADSRRSLPVGEVRQLLYAIWRRAYRVRWPLERAGFRAMLGALSGRETVGTHPDFEV
jgi:ribosomal protein S18 acetylase RimI-like enzyme